MMMTRTRRAPRQATHFAMELATETSAPPRVFHAVLTAAQRAELDWRAVVLPADEERWSAREAAVCVYELSATD